MNVNNRPCNLEIMTNHGNSNRVKPGIFEYLVEDPSDNNDRVSLQPIYLFLSEKVRRSDFNDDSIDSEKLDHFVTMFGNQDQHVASEEKVIAGDPVATAATFEQVKKLFSLLTVSIPFAILVICFPF